MTLSSMAADEIHTEDKYFWEMTLLITKNKQTKQTPIIRRYE